MARMLMRTAFWLPWVACTYLAFAPSPPDTVFRISDVVLHGMAFSYLTFALGLAHRSGNWVGTVAWMVAYGAAIELVQSFEPQRSAELKDMLVDVVGIGIGVVAFKLFGARVVSLVRWLADTINRLLPFTTG
ncbi:MAG: VanZ family protein [Gammaproteobacteria bacterium]|nr:VanZ family protein [Gammaproteobacteria bacterium]